jgi:hypothetical protein
LSGIWHHPLLQLGHLALAFGALLWRQGFLRLVFHQQAPEARQPLGPREVGHLPRQPHVPVKLVADGVSSLGIGYP